MKNIIQSFKIVTLGLILAFGISYAFAWTAPTQAPPGGNVSAPVNVGVAPQIKSGALQVNGFLNSGDSMFDGNIVASGIFGSGSGLSVSGSGTRMIWYPKKAAFRAGRVTGSQWDDANIGNYSTAIGYNNLAPLEGSIAIGSNNTTSGLGYNSIAMGDRNISNGNSSVALGYQNTANNDNSIAIGVDNMAAGNSSIAMGADNDANNHYSTAIGTQNITDGLSSSAIGWRNQSKGDYSVAIGINAIAQAYASIAFGQNIISGNTSSWVDTDPLFVVGNGNVDTGVQSNALTILKNGNIGIGATNPFSKLHINSGDVTIDVNSLAGNGSQKILFREDVAGYGGLVKYDATNNFLRVGSVSPSGTERGMVIERDTGNVRLGTGTTLPQAKLDVDGDLRVGGSKICYYNCYTSGGQVLCDKKRFDTGATVQSGVNMGFTSSITPDAGEGQLVTCTY